MIDIIKTVGQIRDQLRGRGGLNEMAQEALAMDYANAIRNVMDRLDLCDSFLINGYRSEALHLSKIEPEILDFSQNANFAEKKDWDKFCLEHGYPVAGEASANSLLNLNQAYSEDEEVKDLLDEFRRLALSNSSLIEKLTVLRSIHQLDSNNVAVLKNLKDFESYRLKEIEGCAQALLKSKDWSALMSLRREVLDGVWLTPPPDSIVQKIKAISAPAQQIYDNKEFEQAAEKVKRAFGELDYHKVENAMIEFEFIRESLNAASDHPVSKKLDNIRKWMAGFKAAEKRNILVSQQLKSLKELIENRHEYVMDKTLIDDVDLIAKKITKLTGAKIDPSVENDINEFKKEVTKNIFKKKLNTILWVVGPVILLIIAILIPIIITRK